MSVVDRVIARTLPYVPRPVVGRVASRYIAGERLEDAVATVQALNAAGMRATIDALGEDIRTREESKAVLHEYHRALDAVREHRLDAGLSVKPTALGLELSADRCLEQLLEIVAAAGDQDAFVRIDMEDSSHTDETLDLYERVRSYGHQNVGVVLQAMLRRTVADARRLAGQGADVRICKGIYQEPEAIAYVRDDDVRESFRETLDVLVDGGARVAVATHDEALVAAARARLHRGDADAAGYEFQMLLGIREDLRARMVAEGERMRVYVPYGVRWYEYSVRRLKENPRIAGHVARALAARALGRNHQAGSE
jgi:proline dehydrogenase